MWLWLNEKSDISEAEYEKSKTLVVRDSENHHAQHFSTCWGFAMVIKDNDEYKNRKLKDGLTVSQHFEKWSAYISEYLLQRGRKGMLVEIASPSYAAATLKAVYYVYDFAEDPVLKRRASNYLSLYWALWAQEQLDGVRGGGKTRSYAKSSFRGEDFIRRAAWFYFGIGDKPFIHSTMLCFATSSWDMPRIIIDIAMGSKDYGSYEIIQRRMGLVEKGFNEPPLYKLKGDNGGILRYSYVTSDYILGSLMTDALPNESWAAISSQNRWQGAIFASDVDARIYPHCKVLGDSSYNQYWSVQSKGTLITQKLKTNKHAGDMMVWFSSKGIGEPIYKGGWIFSDCGQSWAGIKIIDGRFTWNKEAKPVEGRWLILDNEYSPIIMETAGKEKFDSFMDFVNTVIRSDIKYRDDVLVYESIYDDELTFYSDYSSRPKINDIEVNYTPKFVYDGPFVKSVYDSGVVVIKNSGESVVLDFN
jgi:hypothetical protein